MFISRSFAPLVLGGDGDAVDEEVEPEPEPGVVVSVAVAVAEAWVVVAVAVAVAMLPAPLAVEQVGLARNFVRLGQAWRAELNSDEWTL
jgi:hypothetical protein